MLSALTTKPRTDRDSASMQVLWYVSPRSTASNGIIFCRASHTIDVAIESTGGNSLADRRRSTRLASSIVTGMNARRPLLSRSLLCDVRHESNCSSMWSEGQLQIGMGAISHGHGPHGRWTS